LFAWGGGKIQHGAASIRPYALMAWTRDNSILFHPASSRARLRNPNVTNRQIYVMSSVNTSCCYDKQGEFHSYTGHVLARCAYSG